MLLSGLLILLYTTQGHLPRGGTTDSGLDPPTLTTKRTSTQTHSQASLMGARHQLAFPLPDDPSMSN